MNVEVMTIRLGSAVDREVLRGGVDLAILRIVTLQALHEGDAHSRSEPGIFAVGFLSATPARIAEDIDVGRPERQALIALAQTATLELMMLGARLIADGGRDLEHHLVIERRGEADGLRKHGRRAGASDAVQRFVPPFVFRHIEPRNGRRVVAQLRDLFLQRHARHQVGRSLLERFVPDPCRSAVPRMPIAKRTAVPPRWQ